MGRIVLDTNCLIQSVPPRSRYHAVWQSLLRGDNTLCVTNEILEEYVEIMQKLIGNEAAEYIVKTIINSPFVECFVPYYHFEIIQADPDDNKFVDCAITAGANYIVTNDKHYNILKKIEFPKVDVITLAEFVKRL